MLPGKPAQPCWKPAGTHRVTAPEKIRSIILVEIAAKEESGHEPHGGSGARRSRAGSGLNLETRWLSGTLGA